MIVGFVVASVVVVSSAECFPSDLVVVDFVVFVVIEPSFEILVGVFP